MEVIRLNEEGLERAVVRAAEVLRAGGVILYPTDTLYGLGADAFSDAAVEKIYSIKGREEGKPMHAILADIEMAERYGVVEDRVRALSKKLPRGLLTFIIKKHSDLRRGIAKEIDTFGFRIPDNDFCFALLRAFDGPITATSANRAGMKSERSIERILDQLNAQNSYSSVLQKTAIAGIDLVIDAGELPERKPSTVLDMSGEKPHILRKGALSETEIGSVIRLES